MKLKALKAAAVFVVTVAVGLLFNSIFRSTEIFYRNNVHDSTPALVLYLACVVAVSTYLIMSQKNQK